MHNHSCITSKNLEPIHSSRLIKIYYYGIFTSGCNDPARRCKRNASKSVYHGWRQVRGYVRERGQTRGEALWRPRGGDGGQGGGGSKRDIPRGFCPPFTPYDSLWITGKYTSHIITQLALISFFPCCVMCTIGLELKKEPSNLFKTHTCTFS